MKQTELSRAVKQSIWKVFDGIGHEDFTVESIIIDGVNIPVEAVKKQHRMWTEYRTKHPKKK